MEINIDVLCTNCSKGLDGTEIKNKVYIEPCQDCLEAEKLDAYNEGYDVGFREGREKNND